MIETGLVYLYATTPTKQFVGCGALVEGGFIATCRHVWRDATRAARRSQPDSPLGVEIEYPHARQDGATVVCSAQLVDPCTSDGSGPEPDVVLLAVDRIPPDIMALQLAAHDRFETGKGYAIAGIIGRNPRQPKDVQQSRLDGTIADSTDPKGRRQFTSGNASGYWSAPGSSGSPVFREGGQQLAGILSLSEIGDELGTAALHEAFILPATTIRR